MAINSEIEREVIKGILSLTNKKLFYGGVVRQFDKVYIPENARSLMTTAAVGRNPGEKFIKFYINVGYVKMLLSDKEKGRRFVLSMLEHEILHVVFRHLFIDFADKIRGNVACDISINQYIDEIPDNWMTYQRYDLPAGKSCYWYYKQLESNSKFKQDLKSGAFGVDGIFEYIGNSHEKWKEVTGDAMAERIIKDVLNKAKDACNNNYGNIHGDIIEELRGALKFEQPKVPWARVLKLFVSQAEETRLGYTVHRISKRYGTRPGTRLEDVLSLAVTIDTSGSISTEDLNEFFREINAIHRNGASVTIIEADCDVCRVYPYKGKFSLDVHGRGGTDLVPAMEYVDKNRKFDAHIYFTDFYASSFTKRYRTPVLWVLTSDIDREYWPCSYGRKVNIRDGRPL